MITSWKMLGPVALVIFPVDKCTTWLDAPPPPPLFPTPFPITPPPLPHYPPPPPHHHHHHHHHTHPLSHHHHTHPLSHPTPTHPLWRSSGTHLPHLWLSNGLSQKFPFIKCTWKVVFKISVILVRLQCVCVSSAETFKQADGHRFA